jgi:hypothetical protein
MKTILFFLGFFLVSIVSGQNTKINLEGDWICVDGDAPGISAWDTESLKGMLGKLAKVKNGRIKFSIRNKGEDYVHKFDLKILFPGELKPTEKNQYFDTTNQGSIDPKRFKFTNQVIEFKTDSKYSPYTIVTDNVGEKMILAWEGGIFLYVPKRLKK